jgi:serine/threonine protein kinase
MAKLAGETLLNRYFLRELVGSGGTADVYLAWDNLRSAKVAIKVLRKDLAENSRFYQLFAKEAEVLRTLEHPNIVRFYEFESQNDNIFMVIDWIDGRNLRQLIIENKNPLPIDYSANLLQAIASALNFAHQKQIFHCDVKPANILLHNDGRIFLSDFGVAHVNFEVTGGGTPPYMAPEQFKNETVDGRTDIYALGITLYEMLSGGQVPFRGDTPSSQGSTQRERIAWEHINLPFPPLRKLNPKITPQVEAVISQAMNKEPADRFTNTLALYEAFELAQTDAGAPTTFFPPLRKPAAPASPSSSPPPWPPPVHPPKPARIPSTQAPKPPLTFPISSETILKKIRGPYLLCRSGDFAGQRINIPIGTLTIGRQAPCQLHLSERSVSRLHATLIRGKTGIYIKDENSSMGTLINGKRISTPFQLKNGDIIQIGYYQIFEVCI